MDENKFFWSQQGQNFNVPIVPSTSTHHLSSTTSAQHTTTGPTTQYNQIFQSTIDISTQQVVPENLPLISENFVEQKNILNDCTSTIKTDDIEDHEINTSTISKIDTKNLNKGSSELNFLEYENSDKTLNKDTKKIVGSVQQRAKKLGPRCCQEFCRKSKIRLCYNFDEDTRQIIFDEFWNKLNSDQRHIYVATRVFRRPIPKKFNKDSRRGYNLIYTLRNSNGNSEQVCRDMFLNTLNITEKQVTLWVKKYSIGGDGVSQTKLTMFQTTKTNNKKLDTENQSSNVVKKIKNTPKKINTNTVDNTAGLSELLNYDDKTVTNSEDNIATNSGKAIKQTVNKTKRKHNNYDPNCPDKPKRARHSTPNPELWKRNIIKRLRLEGKAYKSGPNGKCTAGTDSELIERKAKKLLPTCNSPQCNTSSLRHCSTISEWRRIQIFNDFWNKWDWNQRKIFVASMVIRKETKRKKIRNDLISRRQATLIYNLPDDNDIPVQICQKMFINTTGISTSQVCRWIKKYPLGSNIEEKLILRKDSTTHACEWLDKLPKIKSILNGENIFYLNPEIKTFINFYHTYCDVYNKEQGSDGSVVKKYVFMSMCRIKKVFLMPQNDIDNINCIICKEHIKKNNFNDNWNQHNIKKEKAQMEKLKDINLSKNNHTIVLAVHLQPIKCVPILKNPITLYKSRLNCYNFTIYNFNNEFSHCYFFSEDQCGELINNNSKESIFTSIIYDYIIKNCLKQKLSIIIYSDGQLEQTRNLILSNALLNLSTLYNIEIIQKFSEPGHSLVDECFKVNTTFDKYIYVKKKEIYLPSQLAKSIRERKRSPKLFHAIHLDYDYFNDFSKMEFLRYISINPGVNNDLTETLNEKDICAMKYNINGIIKIKFFYDDEWCELSQNINDIKPILKYPKLFTGMVEIPKTKFEDLQDLKLLIPFDCQPFYDSIQYFED